MASTKTSRVQALDDDEIGAHPGEDLEAQGEALTGNEALAIAITDVAADATDLDLDPPDTEDTRTEVAESKKKTTTTRVNKQVCLCRYFLRYLLRLPSLPSIPKLVSFPLLIA